MSKFQTSKVFLVPKLHRAGEFLLWQGSTMLGNILYGFLCIRLLAVADYAKFVVVFAIQGTVVLLLDVGITGSIVPLVGDRIADRKLIADYVASLRSLAYVLYAIIAPLIILGFPWLVRKRDWSWQVVAAMIAILLVSTWFVRISAAYGAVLIVQRDRKRWYRDQMVSSFGTLALLGVFFAFHCLNAYSAILINVAGIIYVAVSYFYRARHLLGVAGVPSSEKRKAIIHLTLPSAPGVIFYALQGQLAVFLITIFGHTSAVAGVGALGRLGRVFTLFSQMNPVLVEPYFARLPRSRLRRNYLVATALVGGFGFSAAVLARIFPEAFLWVLGPKYAHLRFEVFQIMLVSAMGLFGGLMSSMNVARRFVYYWQNASVIVFTLLVQILFVWKGNLSTVRGVLWFNIASSLPGFVIVITAAFYGFARGGRRVPGLDDYHEEG